MCGLFLSTASVPARARRDIEMLVQRRGTRPVRWGSLDGGGACAHSLLPLRGRRPRYQPVRGTAGTVLFTGELWHAGAHQCDTDRVVATLGGLGPRRAFAAFDGNWAVVLHRTRDASVHFATDPIGEQPLHYAMPGGALLVASEIKTLVAAGCALNEVKPVVPGAYYRFKAGVLSSARYTRQRSRPKLRRYSPQRLRALIGAAVQEQASARNRNQQVAILFSGGLDSSIVAHEASRIDIRRAFTVALDEHTPDAVHARAAARALGLEWQLIRTSPTQPAAAIAAGEIANRSIVEEMTMHLPLAARLQKLGIHIALTGCGADELFVGYQHLLGRLPHDELQDHFLASYYRFDLRALSKLYGGFQVELRNPFLSRRVVDYARRMNAQALIGKHRELKAPLRAAYARILSDAAKRPKLIARQTMGVKALFAQRYGDSPYLFRPELKRVLGSVRATRRALPG